MNIPVIERGRYLRGLLIVARLDRRISETDKQIIKKTAHQFGYSPDFYEEILKNLLINEYICNDPIKFDDEMFAKHFMLDAIKIACNGKKLNDKEYEWLIDTASINSIDTIWLEREIVNVNSVMSINYSANNVFSFR